MHKRRVKNATTSYNTELGKTRRKKNKNKLCYVNFAATSSLAFGVCSVGALMSVVFAIMGIKWWFRRRITFTQVDDQRNGNAVNGGSITSTDNHAEQLSLTTTGVYRRTTDIDSFAPIERPKTLPRK